MNYLSFMLLSQADKQKEIWRSGTLIAERQDSFYQYELYQLDDYYAEKRSHPFSRTTQISRTFKAVCYLEPYLKAIDISGLT